MHRDAEPHLRRRNIHSECPSSPGHSGTPLRRMLRCILMGHAPRNSPWQMLGLVPFMRLLSHGLGRSPGATAWLALYFTSPFSDWDLISFTLATQVTIRDQITSENLDLVNCGASCSLALPFGAAGGSDSRFSQSIADTSIGRELPAGFPSSELCPNTVFTGVGPAFWLKLQDVRPGMLLELTACGFDTDLSVFVGPHGQCDALEMAACNGDGRVPECASTYPSRITGLELVAGADYYIVVGGYQGRTGAADVTASYTLTPPAPPMPQPSPPPAIPLSSPPPELRAPDLPLPAQPPPALPAPMPPSPLPKPPSAPLPPSAPCAALAFTVSGTRLTGAIGDQWCSSAPFVAGVSNEENRLACERHYVDPVTAPPEGYAADCSYGCMPCAYDAERIDRFRCVLAGEAVYGCPSTPPTPPAQLLPLSLPSPPPVPPSTTTPAVPPLPPTPPPATPAPTTPPLSAPPSAPSLPTPPQPVYPPPVLPPVLPPSSTPVPPLPPPATPLPSAPPTPPALPPSEPAPPSPPPANPLPPSAPFPPALPPSFPLPLRPPDPPAGPPAFLRLVFWVNADGSVEDYEPDLDRLEDLLAEVSGL